MRSLRSLTSALLAAAALAGCGGDDTTSGTTQTSTTSTETTTGTGGGGTGGNAGGGGAGTGGSAPLCEPATIACEDQVVLELNLKKDPTDGLVQNTPAADGFTSDVDATAGGAFATEPESYLYAKFTAAGLVKVEIGDEDALTSMEWDIAFRRYVVRINSGNSGPSCVKAAKTAPNTAYEDVTSVPSGLDYATDTYFDGACAMIDDSSGLPNSPKTALSDYWTYPNCVQMTGNVFVVELADGRHVKLVFDRFYNEAAQQECQDTGSAPMNNNGSANFAIRWAALP